MSQSTALERIGGVPAIKAATDALYQRLIADRRLRHHFVGVDLPGLRRRMVLLLSQLLGATRPGRGAAPATLAVSADILLRARGYVVQVLHDLGASADLVDLVAAAALDLRPLPAHGEARAAA